MSDKLDRIRSLASFIEAGQVALYKPSLDEHDLKLDAAGEIVPVKAPLKSCVPYSVYQDIADRMFGHGWERRAAEQLVMLHPSDAAAARQRVHARLYGYVPHVVVVDEVGYQRELDVPFRITTEAWGRRELLAKMRAVACGARLSLIGGAR